MFALSAAIGVEKRYFASDSICRVNSRDWKSCLTRLRPKSTSPKSSGGIHDFYNPRIAAELNGQYVKLVQVR